MDLIELLKGDGFEARKLGSKDGGEWGSACPFCGGGQNPDRFRTWPERDRYWCRQCGAAGDSVQYLRDVRKKSYREACEILGVESKKRAGHVPPTRAPRKWEPHVYNPPSDAWRNRAHRFAVRACEVLHDGQHDEVMQWLLNERLLNEETIRTFHIGYCPQDVFEERAKWGLEPKQDDNGKEKRVWIPKGITLPCYYQRTIHGLQIRRQGVEDKKYIVISGSNSMPLIAFTDSDISVIVESRLDCMLINQEAGGIVNAIALGTVSIRPDIHAHKILSRSKTILVALDASDDAGAKSTWTWWMDHYPQALRCYTIAGKDPTESMKNGVILKDWIEAALNGGAMRLSA